MHGNKNKWLPYHQNDERLHLYCFPHAGGSASTFTSFMPFARERGFVVDPVEYPGHGTRLGEPSIESIDELATVIVEVILPSLRRHDFVFLGYSMGALVAYRAAQFLEELKENIPRQLLLCGSQPPVRADRERLHLLPDEDLIKQLAESSDEMNEISRYPELLELFLPIIRNDLKITENWNLAASSSVTIPVTAVAGHEDSLSPPEVVKQWARHTTGDFEFFVFRGNHSFIMNNAEDIVGLVKIKP